MSAADRSPPEFPLLVPPLGSVRLDQVIDDCCGKNGFVRKLDSIYTLPTEGEKQGAWLLSVRDYWQSVCHDLRSGRLVWAARLEPHSPEWTPMSGQLASRYELIDIDDGILSWPGKSTVYDACFKWSSADGPSVLPPEKKPSVRGRIPVNWTPVANEVFRDLIMLGISKRSENKDAAVVGKTGLRDLLIEASTSEDGDREGGPTSASEFLAAKWLKAPKFDPLLYAQAYADLVVSVNEAIARKGRAPGTTIKNPL